MPEFPYDRLRRHPDVEADNLQAHDATDLLLVERALALGVPGEQIAVVGDEYGAITLALADAGLRGIRVHQDLATGRRALANNARELGFAPVGFLSERSETKGPGDEGAPFSSHELDASLLRGARLVLLQLPKSLAELEEIADAVAGWAASDVTLVAGGRVKHMTLAQNEVLGRFFGTVQPQRAERKSRLIVASAPLPVPEDPPFPVAARHGGLTLMAHGGAFAGAKLDIGTRVLLDVLGLGAARSLSEERSDETKRLDVLGLTGSQLLKNAADLGESASDRAVRADSGGVVAAGRSSTVVDLGCGTGALAVSYALAHPEARVIATDRSAAAVASARATVAANGVDDRVTVTHDDAGSEIPAGSADVVLLNPPFHLGSSIHTGAATRLFDAAARLLKQGGELFTVYNSSLGYRAELTRLIGPTEQLHRTPKFTVTRSIRR